MGIVKRGFGVHALAFGHNRILEAGFYSSIVDLGISLDGFSGLKLDLHDVGDEGPIGRPLYSRIVLFERYGLYGRCHS